jgi:hypothetical protein
MRTSIRSNSRNRLLEAISKPVKASFAGLHPTAVGINIYQRDDPIETFATSAIDFILPAFWTGDSSRSRISSDRIIERSSICIVVSLQISIGWNHERNIPKK